LEIGEPLTKFGDPSWRFQGSPRWFGMKHFKTKNGCQKSMEPPKNKMKTVDVPTPALTYS